MLMSVPNIEELYQKCCAIAEEKDKKDLQSALHALRCIIGPRAKLVCTSTIEPTLKQGVVLVTILFTRYDAFSYHNYVYFMSRDNPSVLIKSAIRTCKALTGIDLSNCTQW